MTPKIFVVNAFTAQGHGGNPAGVVLEAEGLSEQQMLDIAAKAGFSETAFITPSTIATRKLRFFTPTEEVELCGHATIASWSLLAKQQIEPGSYTQETKAGLLGIDIADSGLVYMEQTKAQFYETVDPREVAPLLDCTLSDFDSTLEPQVVSTGLKDLLVAVKDEATLLALQPDLEAMAAFSKQHDITGLHVFCHLQNQESVVAARNFAPLYGIPEEAATGTSNGALLNYLRRNKLLENKQEYRIEQGKSMGQLSYIYGKFKTDIVWIGGHATQITD